ncbi:UNVERIFIED_CONTAM: hypothetical protein Sradi_1893200 [Sesamum radiatum]|uniref:Uncharacterized protein n=1 Tax=Sesamum radiatum TaxID=300843 RepID=A0AAW2TXN9_SESRA
MHCVGVPTRGKSGGLALLWSRALEQCELFDLGYTGPPLTWCNRHCTPNTMNEQLDRACTNVGWSQLFPEASVWHVTMNCSDHMALVIGLVDRPVYLNRSTRP